MYQVRKSLYFPPSSHLSSRLTRVNERLERELSELRAITSPVSRTASSASPTRSPAHRSLALPTVSPSVFSIRSSGERDMEISSTPIHHPFTLSDEDRDHNQLSDLELFPGHTQLPASESSPMSAEPSGNDPTYPNSQDDGGGPSTNRPSSAPPDMDDTHPATLLSPFQLSAPLPRRSKSVEPRSTSQERIPET